MADLWRARGRSVVLVVGVAVVLAVLLVLSPVAVRGAFAQEGPGSPADDRSSFDLGRFLGELGHLGDAFGQALTGLSDSIGGGFEALWAQFAFALGLLPRLLAMGPLLFFGLLADALIHAFDLSEVGALLTQIPEGPLREGWVQTMVQDSKGAAFVLLPAALALRAFAWNMGGPAKTPARCCAMPSSPPCSSPRSTAGPSWQSGWRMPSRLGSPGATSSCPGRRTRRRWPGRRPCPWHWIR
jgi:hypothetical protein